uniref:Uncharacterized protein n=1 Tax=Salarias fasciatus TaxID=181472 RepID=A0A672GTG4_SALFA
MLKWKSRQNGNVCQKGSRRTGGRRNSSRRNGNFRVDEMSVNQLVMVSCCVPDNCLDRSALHVAAFEGRLLLRHDLLAPDVDTVTVDNVSALHEACLSGHYESAKLLLENVCIFICSYLSVVAALEDLPPERRIHSVLSWVDLDDITLAGGTPLFYACSSGNAACVQLILERGSSPHAGRRRDGPLHAAVRGGAAQIVTLLLDFGADECCRNEDGQTPPDLSAECSAVRRGVLLQLPWPATRRLWTISAVLWGKKRVRRRRPEPLTAFLYRVCFYFDTNISPLQCQQSLRCGRSASFLSLLDTNGSEEHRALLL